MSFGEVATKLVKSPIGILGLVLVFVDAFMTLAFTSAHISESTESILIWFFMIFTILMIGVIVFLVINHHGKLYSPGDFTNDQSFLQIIQMTAAQQVDTRIDQSAVADDMIRIGRVAIGDGDYEKALSEFKKAHKQYRSARALAFVGYALKRLGRLDEALSVCDEALQIDGVSDATRCVLHWNRACYACLIDMPIDSVKEHLDASLEIAPDWREEILSEEDLRKALENESFRRHYSL